MERLLRERARLVHIGLAVTIVLLLAGEVWMNGRVNTVAVIQLAHLALVLAGLGALWLARSARLVVGITLVEFAMAAAAIAAVGVVQIDPLRMGITMILASLAIAVVMPWGTVPQAVAVGIAGIATGVALWLLPASLVTAREIALEAGALLGSVLVARVIRQQLVAIERERNEARRQAEALARSEALFRTMFEASALGMVRFREDRSIIEVNDALARLLDVPRDALAGQPIDSVVHPDDRIDDGLLAELASGRCEHYQGEVRLVQPSGGASVWGQLTLSSVRDLDGRPSFVAMIDDVTARRLAEQELERARREAEAAAQAKGRFLAIMSHEIRTPLNAVLGFNELLAGTELDETQRHFVETIGRSGRHLTQIINDVLDFSKIESGGLTLERIAVDLGDVVRNTVRMFQPDAEAKGLVLRCDIDECIRPAVLADPKRLRQIITNLVGNAIKFTDRGSVVVRVRCIGGEGDRGVVRIDVEDTGVGIPPEVQRKLFRPFVQADSSTTRKYGGTGLGLAISKQLVELMGGAIEVASEPGRGTTFSVTLPLERAPDDEVARNASRTFAAARAPRPTLQGLRVLVAEDDETSRQLVQRLLARLGCTVAFASNGQEAVEAVARDAYPIVLMDVDMPVMDGIEATHRIRAQFRDDVQPYIVALTAHAMPGDRERCEAAGMNDFVAKPLRLADLEAALSRAIDDTELGPAAWRN